ncbi:MAG TPA: DNA/RNA non-specific endonuclease, partial [Pirellulaceae bacterium]|nr:DNA/RNA non-specific endonuclease [Pirellulaceae bacterium]
YAFDVETAQAAARRWSERQAHHARFAAAARSKSYTALDTRERCAARVNRLLGRLRGVIPARQIQETFGEHAFTSDTVNDAILERAIGQTRDFQNVEFLELGIVACRSVVRVATRLDDDRLSYGTGFMVSPRILLTNNHVLPTKNSALRTTVEFDYQRDRFGRELTPQRFQLDPVAFYLTNKALDFTLVAVSPTSGGKPLSAFGWCPLKGDAGKIVVGEPINIVQHPRGGLKQVVIRENRLLDARDGADVYYHYEADTEPGSSGSPVFNDQWEVVALHHSGVPRRNAQGELLDVDGKAWRSGDDPARLDFVANEGVRVSKLLDFLQQQNFARAEKTLLDELLEARPSTASSTLSTRLDQLDPISPIGDASPTVPSDSTTQPVRPNRGEAGNSERATMSDEIKPTTNGSITITVPLQITLTFGSPTLLSSAVAVTPPTPAAPVHPNDRTSPTSGTTGGPTAKPATGSAATLEKIEPDPGDPSYVSRPGYNSRFLGVEVPFPKLTNLNRSKAYNLPGLSGPSATLLKYHHYSLIFNSTRKLAFVAGVNFDPLAPFQQPRDKDGDRWYFDPRVTPVDLQAGESLYAGNPLDRGHLVRRADAGWGVTAAEAKLASDDTFHFTNCSPQHEITNQGLTNRAPPDLKLWGNLEDYVAAQGEKNKQKLCIFNGPVFRKNDRLYRGVQLPKQFWKVIVYLNRSGATRAAAFVLTQESLIAGLQEAFSWNDYRTVQVRIRDLETLTQLDFGPLRSWDVLEFDGAEASFTNDAPAIVLESLDDLVL